MDYRCNFGIFRCIFGNNAIVSVLIIENRVAIINCYDIIKYQTYYNYNKNSGAL